MSGEPDKREHSTKPEVDDLTDYQSLNSLGGAAVAGSAQETSTSGTPDEEPEGSNDDGRTTEANDSGGYNDGADFVTVDNKGLTNA